MLRLLSTLAVLASTYAYRQDLAKLPNGNSYGLTLGHPGGATGRTTKIASSFYAMGQTWNKAFCLADADGDGQSNGLEMGDPCCKWSPGQVPQFTTGLSDPNSAASMTMTPMPPCIMANANVYENANAKLQCAVCVQALQLDLAKPSDNAAEFSLTSVKSCKGATQDDEQKILCVATLIKNADQLLMDQKNGVTPTQSCMNLGLVCTPTTAPTKAPTAAPTKAPTAAPTTVPTITPTAAPTTVPTAAPTAVPTTLPTAPPPPRMNSMLPGPGVCSCGKTRVNVKSCDSAECFEACDKKNLGHGVCVTNHALQTVTATETTTSATTTEISIMVPILISVAASIGGVVILSLALWRYHVNKQILLEADESDYQPLPDITYSH